jgi:polysaccharide pyruvyl transferase WcaK-like protein
MTGRVPLLNTLGREVINAVRSSDAVYCSGGGNLNDRWLLHELLPRTVTYRLAAVFGKPLVVSGQGIGPLQSRLGRRLLAAAGRQALIFGCRDYAESRDLLLELGLSPQAARSLGDDAVDLRTSPPERAREILRTEGVPEDGPPLLAVHIRLHNFSEDFRAMARQPLADLLDALIDRLGCRVLFIPISYARAAAGDADIGDAFDVYARMRRRGGASFICREKYLPPDMKAIVGQCRALIGFSYHAWVFALTSGLPAFGLYYGDYFRLKATGHFDWYGKSDWAWDVKGLVVDDVVATMVRTLQNPDEWRGQLDVRRHQMVARVEEPIRLLVQSLTRTPEGKRHV